MSLRIRLFFLCALLLLACSGTVLAAHSTLDAVHTWQQQERLARSSDVHLIQPWMTIPYIARVYHVPENYLYQSLHLKNDHFTRSSTLEAIALATKKPLPDLIRTAQNSVLSYRHWHRLTPSPSPSPQPGRRSA